ncbi:MAG: sigma 54-interacting transcriptional regulator, partial [Planctomycetota bacterium]
MESILLALGAEVHLAKNGVEGLAMLKRSPMEVLFVDVQSPETDGVRIAREARLLLPRISTVLVADCPRSRSPIGAQHNGACDRITRPITPEKIRTAMSRASPATVSAEHAGAAFDACGPGIGPMPHDAIVAASRDMNKVVLLANQLAETNVPVLIQGEKGVGKALLARTIHHRRHHGPEAFLHLVCNGIRENHGASRLFSSPSVGEPLTVGCGDGGVWDRTRDGSLFLENIEELPSWAQFKLLDILERRDETTSPRLRVIASTSCDLKTAASEGRVPRELYYLLSVATIRVPALRRRREDIRPLGEHLLERFVRQSGLPTANDAVRFSGEAWNRLISHDWPGNGDELANVLQRAVLRGKTSRIGAAGLEQLLSDNRSVASTTETITVALEGDFKNIQRQIIREVIHRCSGNKAAAARSLGLHRKTIYRLLQEDDAPPVETAAAAKADEMELAVPVT